MGLHGVMSGYVGFSGGILKTFSWGLRGMKDLQFWVEHLL